MRRIFDIDAVRDEDGRVVLDEFGQPIVPIDRVDEKLLAIRPILEQFGGAFIVVPKRVKFEDGSYGTEGFIFKYDSGVPAVDSGAPPAVESPAPEPEPEPVS